MGQPEYPRRLKSLRSRLMKTSMSTRRWTVAAVIFILMVVVMSLEISSYGATVRAGKSSPRTIKAPRTVQYIDRARTREEQDAAAAYVPPVINFNSSVRKRVEKGIEDLFRAIEQVVPLDLAQGDKINRVSVTAGKDVSVETIGRLLSMTPQQRQAVLAATLAAADDVLSTQVTRASLEDAVRKASALVKDNTKDPVVRSASDDLLQAMLQPNATVNAKETARRKVAAREGVKPIITTKLQGEVIIKKGETVTPEQVDLLKTLGFTSPAFNTLNLLWYGLFTLALLAAASLFLARARRPYLNSPSLLALLGGITVFFTIITKVLVITSTTYSAFWAFFVPSAAVALITAVLFDIGIAIMMAIVCSLVTGAISAGNFSLAGFALLGALFPAMMVTRTSTRHEMRRVGLYTSFWLAFVAFGFSALTPLRQDLLVNSGVGLLNGAICSVIALGSLPFLETTFGVPTNTWLLELASPEQGLLKELSVKAPGTYSHSVMVANLAEAAAREVGSDPLLARVAAYYHDVGKMKRPQFFVENQPSDQNPHESLSPNLSALIITSHVKDGVEMLQSNHIPEDLIDIVREHHGTSLVRYFYENALESEGTGQVEESRFRYHFEKPKRKTAGILLLADAVEATGRTLSRPTPAAIELMVDRIVDGKLDDGQLDESDLSFRDVKKIKKVFSRILISTYHPRIDYPGGFKPAGGRGKGADKNDRKRQAGISGGVAPADAVKADIAPIDAGTQPGVERGPR